MRLKRNGNTPLVLSILALVILGFTPVFAIALCPQFVLDSPVEPEFTDTERQLVCGFEEARGTEHRAWADIPKGQALVALRTALQARGYLNPEFVDQGERVQVQPGKIVQVGKVTSEGGPPEFDPARRRTVRGSPLTPEALDDLEAWSVTTLQNMGFPCPVVTSRGDPATGNVDLLIEPGEQRTFGGVLTSGADETLSRSLTRYFSFASGDPFARTPLEFTRLRILDDGIVENTNLAPVCERGRDGIVQLVVPGPPRQIIFGLSANTEEYLRAHVRARHNRVGANDSRAEANLVASFRVQELSLRADWSAWDAPSKSTLEPLVLFHRLDERPFEVSTTLLQLSIGQTWDFRQGFELRWRLGPAFSLYETARGEAPDSARALSLWGDLWAQSFEFPIYGPEPRRGYRIGARVSSMDRAVGSDFSATWLETSGTWLLNLDQDDPPRMVIALRGHLATTLTPDGEDGNGLPPVLRHFLGGFHDLRGFERLSLGGPGALSRASMSVELRPDFLDPVWQPFAFVDMGALGAAPATLDTPVFWSPGAGIKYRSPLGPLRASISNGRIFGEGRDDQGPESRWQIYASWGELF
jgi:translocation and assembly module TamA